MKESVRKIGVSLVNWNGGNLTCDCIRSILGSTIIPDEIFVYDNGSSDNSLERIKKSFPGVTTFRNNKNIGFTGANNYIISYFLKKGFDVVWILNNDTIVARDCLEILLNELNPDENILAVTGKILFGDDTSKIWYGGAKWNPILSLYKHIGEGEKDKKQYDEDKFVPFISGCCMVTDKRAFDKIGSYDDNYFAYNEDGDWCYRAAKANIKMRYVHQAVIYHKVSSSLKKNSVIKYEGKTSPLAQYLHMKNRIYFMKKNIKNPFFLCTSIIYTIYKILKLTIGLPVFGRFDNLKYLYKGLYAGLKIAFFKKKPAEK